jgi:hypothetical protein
MAEWYDVDAVDANANAVDAQKYRCNCGCNLEFIDYKPGIDIYIGNNWIITSDALVDYSWRDYLYMHEFTVWQELREYIILNYNDVLNNGSLTAEDAPWVHLYNKHVVGKDHIPLNAPLYYDYVS